MTERPGQIRPPPGPRREPERRGHLQFLWDTPRETVPRGGQEYDGSRVGRWLRDEVCRRVRALAYRTEAFLQLQDRVRLRCTHQRWAICRNGGEHLRRRGA